GPDLTGLGRSKGRDYVLRALLDPNAEIAPGYESVALETHDDALITGILKEETASELILVTPEAGRVTVRKSDLKSRARGLSAMPDGLGELMTLRELRDLIEAISN
ncbi:MAG: hypothetical protein KIT22_08480, partial [Verrucomicrobiae bacterium]|nr:hypothetical protein [Verrucomicrobiae bacterium]